AASPSRGSGERQPSPSIGRTPAQPVLRRLAGGSAEAGMAPASARLRDYLAPTAPPGWAPAAPDLRAKQIFYRAKISKLRRGRSRERQPLPVWPSAAP